MKHYFQTTKTYLTTHKKESIIGAAIIAVFALLVALFIYNLPPPTVVYQPADACKLFTPAEAQDLLGDKVISLNTDTPILSGNVATSKCSYTDTNPDSQAMLVAAVAIRSGVNNKGVQQNKAEFASNKSRKDVTAIQSLGDSAYFNPQLGQLNILDGRNWVIISYGAGAAPTSNTIEDTLTLAHLVLPNQTSKLPQF